jgi:hypothetical protein
MNESETLPALDLIDYISSHYDSVDVTTYRPTRRPPPGSSR